MCTISSTNQPKVNGADEKKFQKAVQTSAASVVLQRTDSLVCFFQFNALFSVFFFFLFLGIVKSPMAFGRGVGKGKNIMNLNSPTILPTHTRTQPKKNITVLPIGFFFCRC